MMKISDLRLDLPAHRREQNGEAVREGATLEDMIRAVVSRYPDRAALADEAATLRFSELDGLSAAVARFIVQMDYGSEAAVGVLCRRGALFLAAAFGVLRAGAVYVPVEREQPLARQEAMLRPARLIITDSHCLREAEFLRYRLPGIAHVLCIDVSEVSRCVEKGTELASTAFWEHVAQAGSDGAWKSVFDAAPLGGEVLHALAGNVLGKSGLAGMRRKRVLDIGSGSGVVAKTLMGASDCYTAVELARNELDRIGLWKADVPVRTHQMDALDISFLEGEEFDLIALHGVVENFPGYAYLRRVLDAAVQMLSDEGVLFVGSVWDMDRRDALRDALKAHALASGSNSGLLRLDTAAELFVPGRFFAEWAAESPVPVEIAITGIDVGNAELAEYRYDVVIRKNPEAVRSAGRCRFGTEYMYSLAAAELPVCAPEQAAYIVYTSGSTGVPKGVVVEHRHLLHILRALREFAQGCGKVALVAPLSFDASVQQLAVSIFCGNTLYVMSDAERKSPELFHACLVRNGIDLCDMTPAFFNVLVEYLFERKLALPVRRILLAGEILRPDTIRKFYGIAGNEGVVLFNVYGPTECTVDSSAFRIDFSNYRAFSSYPIGRALQGVDITIRDRGGRVLPDSVTGEIWISGAGVCRGYLPGSGGDGAFVTAGDERCYRTGDNGFMKDGLLFYVGREDQQVKIRGNRVEVGEVENAIAGFPGVRQVAVVAGAFRSGGEKSLAAYVVGEVDTAALRSYLEVQLPSYCVPEYYVLMVELPFSMNRKVDRKGLPSPVGRHVATGGRRPEGEVEEKLAGMWKRLLGVDVADAEVSFFNLGGHSILAIRLIAMIEKEMGVHLTVNELFAHPTIAQLAGLFRGKAQANDSPVIRLCHKEGGKNLFLFHPVGGSVFCYSGLASLLGHEYTVYAVEAAGFRPERTALNTELHRVEDLAAYYLEEILKVETRDIVFGGWSFGGLLAYEAACRYERMGYGAGPVLILDTVADSSQSRKIAAKDDVELLKTLLQESFGFDEQVLRSLPREGKLAYLVECGEREGLLPAGFSAVQMDNLLQTYRINTIAVARYTSPTPTDKRILLVRALDFSGNAQIVPDDDYQGWSRFLRRENIDLRWTEGTHETMLAPGLVDGVAKHILEYLG